MRLLQKMSMAESKKFGGKAHGLRRLVGLRLQTPITYVLGPEEGRLKPYQLNALRYHSAFPLAVRSSAMTSGTTAKLMALGASDMVCPQ